MWLSTRHLHNQHGFGVDHLPPNVRRRLSMLSRSAAAVVGGYGLTTAATLLMARISPFSPLDRIMWPMMMSFALYAAVIIWSFAARSVVRVWLSLSIGTLGCALLAWLAGSVGT